ncbi:peptidoglycan-binding protein LysM [uncultured Dokdonia sp.]|uniref:peptidoglycan-binding protein LysM n=1 Tax=uncultured Dokdonia sp. TaxID=575653 RepID=UPI002613FB89|nr:peptidoglycan-binding protein LysM [uncultured Dokdonia sp.]
MVRSLVKITVLPFMIGLLSLGNISEKKRELTKTEDFSQYSTKGLDLYYTVPLPEETVQEVYPTYFPLALTGGMYIGFKEALAFKESQGNYFSINTFGYMGKYQFGASTLDLIGIKNTKNFIKNPALQEQAFLLNTSRNKWVLRRDIKRFSGKWVGGIKITESGILAAAHLAGPGSVKRFLRSGGEIGFNDAYGTSIRSYLRKFSGFDVSFVQAVKRPRLEDLL